MGLHRDLENNQEFRYTYDSKGRVESVTAKPTASGFSKSEFKNVFNSKDQLTSVKRKVGGTTLEATYNYSSGGRLTSEEFNNNHSQNYGYDSYGRVGTKTIKNASNSSVLSQSYAFANGTAANTTTTRISTETISGNGWSDTYVYTYDNNGNVTKITKNGQTIAEYSYDSLNQLISATVNGRYYNYSYDSGGNMLTKCSGSEEVDLTYGEYGWEDLIATYNGQSLLYDEMGNLTYYLDGKHELWWEGRQLKHVSGTSGGTTYYSYNSDGIRTKKTIGSNTTYYTLDGTKIVSQKTGSTEIFFEYDATGNVATMIYGGNTYYYVRNMLGEILGLADQSGNLVVTYAYDPWGKILSTTDTTSNNIGTLNPFRYKGYYYDSETGFYYLNSRYYDPEICKFLSAEPNVYDGEFDEGAGLLAYNVTAYCANNPVMYMDETGESITLACVLIGAGIGLIVGAVGGSHYAKHKKKLTPSDGWDYWKYVVGFGVAGGAVGALVGWGAGALIAKYGVATAATSITKGGGARFSSFSALKRSLGSAGKGFDWHHIVEQCQINKSGFSKYWIQNSNNVVRISKSVHSKVTAYYNRAHGFTNGMKFRNWLAGQDFKTQYEWGIKVLRMYGVKI